MKGLRDPEFAIGIGTALVGAGLAVGATQIASEAGYSGVGPNFLPWVAGSPPPWVVGSSCRGWHPRPSILYLFLYCGR